MMKFKIAIILSLITILEVQPLFAQISLLLAQRSPNLSLKNKPSPVLAAEPASQSQTLPPEAAAVDKTAQKITVRIDSPKHGNGSGVVIARRENVYYVLTAAHVLNKPDEYTLVASNGKEYPLSPENITLLEGVDLAIAQFTSDQTYPVATLAKYKLGVQEQQLVFCLDFLPKSDRNDG